MEKQPQADSSVKSPASKSPVPPEKEEKLDDKSSVISSTKPDPNLEAKGSLKTSSYQECESKGKDDENPIGNTSNVNKIKTVADSSIDGGKLSHSIISVDIHKSMPCDTKEPVPHEKQQDSKPETAVTPEVLATVVTNAVVNEAALTISETNGITNGTKVAKDSSKVDALVEQELNKLSDLQADKTDTKFLESSNGDSKPMPNGDIDHSPVGDRKVDVTSKAEKESNPKEENAASLKEELLATKGQSENTKGSSEKDSDKISESEKLDSEGEQKLEKIELGSCNGVPGIITVESITKKETVTSSAEIEKSNIVTDSEKSTETKGNLKSDSKEISVKKLNDDTKLQNGIVSKNVEVFSVTDNTAAQVCGNLTDSAKLRNENLISSAKLETVSEATVNNLKDTYMGKEASVNIAEKDSKQIADEISKDKQKAIISKDDASIINAKKETTSTKENIDKSSEKETVDKILDKEAETTKSKDALQEKSDVESKSDKSINKDFHEPAQKTVKKLDETSLEDKTVKDKINEASGETNKKDDKANEGSLEQDIDVAKKSFQVSGEREDKKLEIKTDTMKQMAGTIDVKQLPKDEKLRKASVDKQVSAEEICDMTAMMTSQILTPEDLGIEVPKESTDKEKEKVEEVSKILNDSCSISARKINGKTCDVGVGLNNRIMARVAAPGGEEEEVDGQQASTEVEVTEDVTVTNGVTHEVSLITNGTGSPINGTATSPSSAKSSSTASSKPASAVSEKGESKQEAIKSASAVSRSSIPEPIVYEPPERRKSAASLASQGKKDPEADKSQLDEKESEKESKEEEPAEKSEEKTEVAQKEEPMKEDNKLEEEKSSSKEQVKDDSEKITLGDAESKILPAEKETAVEKEEVSEKEETLKDEKESEITETHKSVDTPVEKDKSKTSTPEPLEAQMSSEKEKGQADSSEKEVVDNNIKESGDATEKQDNRSEKIETVKDSTSAKVDKSEEKVDESDKGELDGGKKEEQIEAKIVKETDDLKNVVKLSETVSKVSETKENKENEEDLKDKLTVESDATNKKEDIETLEGKESKTDKTEIKDEKESHEDVKESKVESGKESEGETTKLKPKEEKSKVEVETQEEKADVETQEGKADVKVQEVKADIETNKEKPADETQKVKPDIDTKEENADVKIEEQETDKETEKEKAEVKTEEQNTDEEIKKEKDEVESKKEEVTETVKKEEVTETEKKEEVTETEKKEEVTETEKKEEILEEPKTLIEESKVEEASEKESAKSEEKEEDDTEKETTPGEEVVKKEDDNKEEEEITEDEKREAEAQEVEEKQSAKTEDKNEDEVRAHEKDEGEEKAQVEDAEEEVKPDDEGDKADQPETEEKEEEKTDDQGDEQEKQDVGKDDSAEKHPKSPTKRTGSPTKRERRGSLPQLRLMPKSSSGWGKGLPAVGRISPFEGISPIASPPKALKTPPSPQKPQKTTSPKKKNGMLSPIKTPKTPGSDGRKLPPIKAPVGLAPNPNLKNIRSKIGSFDNIRYKPGGGDKKVITKKLEWKATPKIGSLDHSHKGKHGKSTSKGESKDAKMLDGQSPLPSGDEGDAEGIPSGVAETLIKPDATGSTEMPPAITAES